MKPQKAVIQETRRIAIGTAILCALMLIVFLAIGQMTWLVALGALIGYAVAVGNAVPQVKAVAHEVIAPNTQHSVARWIASQFQPSKTLRP